MSRQTLFSEGVVVVGNHQNVNRKVTQTHVWIPPCPTEEKEVQRGRELEQKMSTSYKVKWTGGYPWVE